MDAINPINQFRNEYRFLSNFYSAPFNYLTAIDGDLNIYPSTEHAYQAYKLNSLSLRKDILNMTAGESKKFVRKFNKEYLYTWAYEKSTHINAFKINFMTHLIKIKFSDHFPHLKNLLIETGERKLIEGNFWGDIFWGICLKTNQGENNLGKILMKVRNEIKRNNH